MSVVQFPSKETIVGYIDTDSGGILLTDAVWESTLPRTSHKYTSVDLGEALPSRIPVYAKLVNGRRFIIIDIDAATNTRVESDFVEVNDPVEAAIDPDEPVTPETSNA